MKIFKLKYLIISIFLLIVVPIIAIALFVYFKNRDNANVMDIGSFITGIFTYIGTIILGIVVFIQNDKLNNLNNETQKRLNDLNNETQKRLAENQINYSKFLDAKTSIIKAISTFDIHKLEHLINYVTNDKIDEFLKELFILKSNIRQAESDLFLNSDCYVNFKNNPCFVCDKGKDFQTYVKSLDNFKYSYNNLFEKFMIIIAGLEELFIGYKTRNFNSLREKNYTDMIAMLNENIDSNGNKISELKNKINELSNDDKANENKLNDIFRDIVDHFRNATDIYTKKLNSNAKIYIAELQNHLLQNKYYSCEKIKKYYEKVEESINQEYKQNNISPKELEK